MKKKYIWYEKYRPSTLDTMKLPERMKKKFQEYLTEGDIPHLLLLGPKGSGKTSVAYILMNIDDGPRVVLNASSKDRGIDTIRGLVKMFARSASAKEGQLKIVLLDEADAMTRDAQMALRNTMETYSDTCRFILTGNYRDRIIPEIHSRCTPFMFDALPSEDIERLLESVLNKEGITFDENDLYDIVQRYYPDVRSMFNAIQVGSVDGELVIDGIPVFGGLDFEAMEDCINLGDFARLRKLWSGITDFIPVYQRLFNVTVNWVTKDSALRAKLAQIIATYMFQDSLVADKEINAAGCALEIMTDLGLTKKIRW